MRSYIIFQTLLLATLCAPAQMRIMNAEETVRFLADKIIENTHRTIIHSGTGELFDSSKDLPVSSDYHVKSNYTDWQYQNGVLNMAMVSVGEILTEKKYVNYSLENYAFIFDNLEYFQKQYEKGIANSDFFRMFRMSSLDDCGTMGAGLIETYLVNSNSTYYPWIEKIADYISDKQIRSDDNILIRDHPLRFTLWSDDLYMSVSFLSRMGKLTGDIRYFDDAAEQVIGFTKYLFNKEKGLYYHCYFTESGRNGVAHWGRGNGWVMMAQADLLSMLPKDHPRRDELIKILQDYIIGISRIQSGAGLWHQLLDKTDSYLESSVSAMFIYGVAKAVNEGWIHPSYGSIALKGWAGLYNKITEDAQVTDICVGTHIEQNLSFYYNRPRSVNDTHGLAATLLAGTEIIKLNK